MDQQPPGGPQLPSPWLPPPPPPAYGWASRSAWTPPPPPPANGKKVAIIVASVLGGCCLLLFVLLILAPFILVILGIQTTHSDFQVITNNQLDNSVFSNAVNDLNVV